MAGSASLSWAQFPQTFFCSPASPGASPVFVRAEGRTELVKDLVFQCTGGTAGQTALVNVEVFLNTNITSKILNPAASENETLLLINEPASPTVGFNAFQAKTNGTNRIIFLSVPIPAAGNGITTIRITNIRADASAMISGISSNEPVQIYAFTSMTGATSIPISQPQRSVAFVVPGINFSLRSTADNAVAGIDLTQSAGQNNALVSSSTATGGSINYLLKFNEMFATSFKPRNVATTTANPGQISDQSVLGTVYRTETGYYNSTLPATNGLNSAGLPTQGTRLIAKFNSIPNGVKLYTTTAPIASMSSLAVAAPLVSTDSNGAGTAIYLPQTTTATCAGCPAAVGIAPVTIVNGSGVAVWEVITPIVDLNQFAFGLVVAYASPVSGSPSVGGVFGPIGTASDTSPTASMPRFGSLVSSTAGSCSNSSCIVLPSAVNLTYQMGSGASPSVLIPMKANSGQLSFFANAMSGPPIQNPTGDAPPGSWLSVTPSSAITPATLTITADPSNLPPGIFSGYVSVVAPGAANSPQWVYVQLTVTAASGGSVPNTMVCSANAGVPPVVRAEGVTELLGDIVLACTGGTPTAAGLPVPGRNIVVSLNTDITSRLVGFPSSVTEALLVIDEPSPSVQKLCASPPCSLTGAGSSGVNYENGASFNVFPASLIGGQLSWSGVPIDPPSTGARRTLRITNLRGNVARLPVSTGLIPTQIFASISFPGTGLSSTQLIIAYSKPGKTVTLSEWGGNFISSLTFQKAGGVNPQLVTSSAATGAIGNFAYAIREGFSSSAKMKVLAGSIGQSFPGYIYNTESGFYNPFFSATNGLNLAGLATQGTRFMARFDNVPSGVKLFATVNSTNSGSATAQLVSTDNQGAGVYAPVSQTTTALFGAAQFAIAPVTITNGSGVAVWEVTGIDPLIQETLKFGIVTAYTTPVAGSATLTGLLAPTTTISNADNFSPVPRFDERGIFAPGCFRNCAVASPGSIYANAQIDGPAPPQQQINIGSNGVPFFALFSTNQRWMSVNQAGAILPASITLTFDTSGLAVGTYSGSVFAGSTSIPVTLTITSSGASAKAAITSPVPRSALTSTSATFNWDAGVNVTQYQLLVGTKGIGSSDIYSQTPGTAKTQLITGLPTDSRTLYVRLGSFLLGAWQYNDYTYIAGSQSVSVTIESVPPGGVFGSEGTGCDPFSSRPFDPNNSDFNYIAPITLTWIPGSTCTLRATQYIRTGIIGFFDHWEDNSTNPDRTLTVPATSTTYTATYRSINCTYQLSSTSSSVGPSAGSGSFTDSSGCTSIPTSNAVWITASFSNANSVTYSYEANSGAARTGIITVGDKTFTLTQAAGIGTAIDSGPLAASGATQILTLKFSHPQGYQLLGVVNALINQYLDGNAACYIAYSQPLRVLYLVNDQGPGSGLSAGLALGATGSVTNGQCTIFSAGSSASGSGNILTLTVNIAFKSAFSGNKVIYLAAQTVYDVSSGWQTLGVSQIPGSLVSYPNPTTMTPAVGTVSNKTITFEYSDASNNANLQTAWALINTAIDGRQACYVAYYSPGNLLYLYPDNGDGTAATSISLTGTNTIQNSQCMISAAGSTVLRTGNTLSLSLNVTFKSGFAGSKGVWAAVQTIGGTQTSAWKAVGTWLVP